MIEIGIETITPEVAEEYLQKNVHNRQIKLSKVKVIARDIVMGEYKLTHQGISFDEDGNLLDGQHRLKAIVLAGKPIDIFVARGVPRDAITGIDSVTPRTLENHEDVMKTKDDFKYTNKHGTIAKIIEFGPNDSISISMSEMYSLIDKYIDGIEFAMKFSKIKHAKSVILAVIARAYYGTDNIERLSEFMEVYRTGEAYTKDDVAAIKFRNYMLSYGSTQTGFKGRDIVYHKAETALRAFIKRKQLRNLPESRREYFQIPDSVVAGKWSIQDRVLV